MNNINIKEEERIKDVKKNENATIIGKTSIEEEQKLEDTPILNKFINSKGDAGAEDEKNLSNSKLDLMKVSNVSKIQAIKDTSQTQQLENHKSNSEIINKTNSFNKSNNSNKDTQNFQINTYQKIPIKTTNKLKINTLGDTITSDKPKESIMTKAKQMAKKKINEEKKNRGIDIEGIENELRDFTNIIENVINDNKATKQVIYKKYAGTSDKVSLYNDIKNEWKNSSYLNNQNTKINISSYTAKTKFQSNEDVNKEELKVHNKKEKRFSQKVRNIRRPLSYYKKF